MAGSAGWRGSSESSETRRETNGRRTVAANDSGRKRAEEVQVSTSGEIVRKYNGRLHTPNGSRQPISGKAVYSQRAFHRSTFHRTFHIHSFHFHLPASSTTNIDA